MDKKKATPLRYPELDAAYYLLPPPPLTNKAREEDEENRTEGATPDLVYGLLEFRTYLKGNTVRLRYLNLFVCFGVLPYARLSHGHLKRPEAYELNRISLREGFLGYLEQRVESARSIGLCETGFVCNSFYQLCLIHDRLDCLSVPH